MVLENQRVLTVNRPALVAQLANMLSCSAAGLADWLARQHGFDSESGFCLHAMRLNSRTGTESPHVCSIKCDRLSHPDWRPLNCGESRLHG